MLIALMLACATTSKPPTPVVEPAVAAVPDQPIEGFAVLEPTPNGLDLQDPNATHVSGVIEIDPQPGGKKFQGVWLVQDDTSKLLLAYRPYGWLKAFEGETVRVSGERYQPEGQSIGADHFRVFEIKVSGEVASQLWISAGREVTREGTFSVQSGEPGSKMADDAWMTFSAGGLSYQLANSGDWKPGAAKVTGRPIERSPFTAHMPGPTLWVIEADQVSSR